MKKTLVLSMLVLAAMLSAASRSLVFHFDFKDAAGKKEYADKTGKFKAIVKDGAFAVQSGALRTSVGAQITVPDTRKPQRAKELTVMSWILKKSTPDHTPILSKGEQCVTPFFITGECCFFLLFFFERKLKWSFVFECEHK